MAPRLVLTQLRAGDELGSFPGHIVPRERNLSELYKRTPKAMMADNGIDPNLPLRAWQQAIEGPGGLLERAGSKRWTGERFLVDDNVRILLPEMNPPPRRIVGVPNPNPGTGVTPGEVGLGLGGLALAALGAWAFFGD